MPKVKIRFLNKPTCTTGRKARGLLLELGAEPESRDLSAERLTEAELEALVGQRDYKEFLNPCNELYRTQKRARSIGRHAVKLLELLAKEPNLIGRPVVTHRSRMVLGFNDEAEEETAAMSALSAGENSKEWR